MQHLQRMDGLRGLLAVYVMLGHALPFTALPPWLTRPFSHGEAAVDLFFALSGLVMVSSLERHGGRFLPFIAARARRLLPVYFFVLAFAVLLLRADPLPAMPWVGPPGAIFWAAGLPRPFLWHLLAHLTLLHGLIPQGTLPYAYITLLGPAWSLSTEWQFYLVIGLSGPRRISGFTLALLAAGILYRVLPLPPAFQFSRAFLPDAAPFFALGLASALWLRGGGPRLFLVCLTAAAALELLSGPGKILIPFAWALAVLAQKPGWGAVLEHPALLFLGAISYPLYLLNEPVQRGLALLLAPLAHGDAVCFTLLWLPAALAATFLAATALHFWLERPFMRTRKKIFAPVIAAPAAE